MLGWEFPPLISGGLGTACYGLTKAMSEMGVDIEFVLPAPVPSEPAGHVRLVWAGGGLGEGRSARGGGHVRFHAVASSLRPYQSPDPRHAAGGKERTGTGAFRRAGGGGGGAAHRRGRDKPVEGFAGPGGHYRGDLFGEVHRYAHEVAELACEEEFEIIHAHDWMTYPAGIMAADLTGKPLVVHVHSTEFDRSGPNVNQIIYDIERHGMHAANRIIAVSHLTKRLCVTHYGVAESKVEVVHNGCSPCAAGPIEGIRKDEKVVLFLGRVTMQKGPEYFLAAAKKVLEKLDDVKFVMAGNGDMMRRTIEMAAAMGVGHRVLFTGFLSGDQVERVYRMADLYVMPSVSEPFGIAPLEAMARQVPVIISKQSGVAEVLRHVLKVDFWDIHEMANKIIAVLTRPVLHEALRRNGLAEVGRFRWSEAAARCVGIYRALGGSAA